METEIQHQSRKTLEMLLTRGYLLGFEASEPGLPLEQTVPVGGLFEGVGVPPGHDRGAAPLQVVHVERPRLQGARLRPRHYPLGRPAAYTLETIAS